MHSERDILVKKVFPDIRARLLPYRIRLIDIDLRWGITREEAENEKTIDFCLDSINDCRPLFLGILGERYGWIPAPYPEPILKRFPELVKDGQTSITALEIIHGVLSEQNDNAVFFFRDPKFQSSVPEGFAPIVRAESTMHAQKQRELKELIRNEQLVSPLVENYPCTFKGLFVDWELLSEEAPKKVLAFMKRHSTKGFIKKRHIKRASNEVDKWLQEHATLVLDDLEVFVEEVQHALWKMLCHTFPELNQASGFEDKPEELEDDEHQRVLDEHLATFVGRDSLREEFLRGEGGQLQVLSGASGRGKTAMLATLVNDWKTRWPQGEAVFHFVGATSSGQQADRLFSRLLRLVSRSAGMETPGGISKDFLPNALRKVLEDFPSDKQLLIAVDDFDMVFKNEGFDLRWLPEKLPSNVSILLNVLDDQSWSENNLHQLGKLGAVLIPLPALRESERKEIIRKIPSLWAKTLDSAQIDLLSNHPATNNPLYLTIALEELRKFGSFERLEKRIQKFPHLTGEEGLVLLYQQLIDRLERELGQEVVSRALGLLACSLTGLREEEIIQLCPDIERENLAQLWRELRAHLLFSQGMLSFYHETLSLTIHRRYLGTRADKLGYHRQLVAFFDGHAEKERALAELLEHHYALGSGEAIRSLLSQPENYVIMRHSYPNWLNTHWNRIDENNPTKILHESLCRNLGAYNNVLNNKEGVPLRYWQLSNQPSEIKLYLEADEADIQPLLADWQHDLLIELSRTVEESKLQGNEQFLLAIKCLAILEEELGPAHARTLEALSVALPLLVGQSNSDKAREYHTRAFMMAMAYLPEQHPVCLKIRMSTQDFLRRNDPERSFISDFEELAQAYASTGSCEKLKEFERDALIREDQRSVFFAHLLIRHSQMLRESGESQASYEFCKKAVSFCDKALGPVHENAILARNNLAMHLYELKDDFEGGRKILKETLAHSDARVGTSSFVGLTLLNNLSASLGNEGKFEEALPIYRDTVDRKLAVYGAENPSTLHSIYNLAFCHSKLGQFDQALELCRQAIAGFESRGKGYESDLNQLKLHEIEFIEESGDSDRAMRLFESFYQDFIKNFDHDDWLSYYLVHNKLASIMKAEERHEEVAKLYEDMLRNLRPFEAATKETDQVFQDLMLALRQLMKAGDKDGSLEQRLGVLERMIAACEQRFPQGDPLLFHWQSEYGDALNKAGRFVEAEAVLRACVEHMTALKGADDPNTRKAGTRLSQSLRGLDRMDEAGALNAKVFEDSASRKTDELSMIERHLGELEDKYGPDHPQTIDSMQQAAKVLIEGKHAQEALPLLKEAYERSQKTYGMLADQTISIARDLADLYMDFGEFSKAEVMLRRVADNYESKEGLNHQPTLETLALLGEALMGINEVSEAIAVFQKTLGGCREVYGPLARQTLNALIYLSRLYHMEGKESERSKNYAEFLEGISGLGKAKRIGELFTQYQEEKEKQRRERIGRSLDALKKEQELGKMPYLENNEEGLRKQAESFSERELKPEKPEGSGSLMQWLDLMTWLIPADDTVELWKGFCSGFEALCDEADPVKYLPRFKFAIWFLRIEEYDGALEQLAVAWQGNLQAYYVQEAAFQTLQILAKTHEPEVVISVLQNMGDNFISVLGAGSTRTHLFIRDSANYLFEIGEYKMAGERYKFLLEQTEGRLGKDHPFMQNILQKLEAIDQEIS